MSEFSRNQDTESMRKKDRKRIENVRMVLGYLIDRHGITEPTPSRIPGQIGAVSLPHELALQVELPFEPPLTQPVLERPEAAQLSQTVQHGWRMTEWDAYYE